MKKIQKISALVFALILVLIGISVHGDFIEKDFEQALAEDENSPVLRPVHRSLKGVDGSSESIGGHSQLSEKRIAPTENSHSLLSESDENSHSLLSNSNLEVHFLDIGQGDSIYIRTPDNQDILIDGGPDKNVLSELGKVMPYWDHDIDVMILTHPHSDHVTGLVEVLRRYDVKQIYYTGVLHTAPDYIAWLEEIQKQQIPLNIVQSFFEMDFGNEIVLQFLYPQYELKNKKVSELNNSSIVNKLIYKNTAFLFTGDAEEEQEEELLQMNLDLSADVFKAGHHGSSSSNSEEFLFTVDPEFVVIQCGENNEFGHPHERVLARFERLGYQVFRNDLDGTVSFYSDGEAVFTK